MKNKLFVFGSIAVAIGLFAAMKIYSPSVAPVANNVSSANDGASYIRPHNVSYGNTLGRVSVVEWFDPACEACTDNVAFSKSTPCWAHSIK